MPLMNGQAVVINQDTLLEDGTSVSAGTAAVVTRSGNEVRLATVKITATGQYARNVPHGSIVSDPDGPQPLHVLLDQKSDL